MIEGGLLKDLRRIVGDRFVTADAVASEVYSYDASLDVSRPGVVVFPGSTTETAGVVKALTAAGIPCVPRGFGTNLSGGSIPLHSAGVIALSRLNRIVDITPQRRIARVQCGVTNLEVQNALSPLGYFYAPDPASQKVATLGGNVAENAGGPHCLKYGVTTNHILGLEVVLPNGEICNFGGPCFDSPGYDLRGLLVGSEGTFAIVTEATLRIMRKPESVITMLAVYDGLEDAARSVSAIISQGIVPATLEMMDQVVISAVEDSLACGYPRDAAAVLIIEVEGPVIGLKAQADHIKDICMAHGSRGIREAKDDAERNRLWAGRRGAFGAIARVSPNYLVADCTVPRTCLPEALGQVTAASQKHGLRCGNVFHAGDGNLHPLLFFDARDPEQVEKVHAASQEITRACVRLGGTITGEHGVGMAKVAAMRLVFSDDDLEFQRQVKKVFDPHDLLNPGKVIPPKGSADAPPGAPAKWEGEWIPATPAEACEAVRAAIAARQALLPLGSGTLAGFGNLPARPEIPLRSHKLSGIIEYDPANQLAVFGAGTKWRTAQALLAENRQWIPLRPPLADDCTLGGVVAVGAWGPERAYYGAPRDRLLGLKFVSGEGRLISAGGKVMKNVAGYDITRLLCGSAGTLGFLTQLNFRIASIPESCRAVRAKGSLAQCARAAALLLDSALDPVFVTALFLASEGEWEFKAGFEGFHDTVLAQLQGGKEKGEECGLRSEAEFDYPPVPGAHSEDLARLCDADFCLRANLPIGAIGSFLEKRASNHSSAFILADFAGGCISVGMPVLDPEGWRTLVASSDESGGSVVLQKAPTEFKRYFDVFGSPRAEWTLIHCLKAALDPRAVFSPGRLPGRK